MKGLLFTYTLTYGGALVSLFSPFYGFLIYVCFAIVRPEDMWFYSVPEGNYSRIVALAMLAGWLIHMVLSFFTGKGCNFRLGRGKLVIMMIVGYFLWTIFLATRAVNQQLAWGYVESMGKILLPILVGITQIDSIKRMKQLAWTIVISEGYVAFEMNVYYFRGYNRLWQDGFGGVDNNSAAIALVTVIGLSAFLFLHSQKLWQKAILGGATMFMVHAVLFSFSRGGMLAMIICAGVGFVLLKKSLKHYLAFGLVCCMAISLAGPEVRARFMRTFEQKRGKREASAQSRLDLWKDCWTLLKEDPIMGCGPDHWPTHAHKFGWPRGKEAHSLWVQTATETGFPGIFMFAGFYGFCMWRLWRLLRTVEDDEDPWFADVCRMVIAGLCGFCFSAQFVSLEALEVPYYVALLGASNFAVYAKVKREEAENDEEDDSDYFEDDEEYEFDPLMPNQVPVFVG